MASSSLRLSLSVLLLTLATSEWVAEGRSSPFALTSQLSSNLGIRGGSFSNFDVRGGSTAVEDDEDDDEETEDIRKHPDFASLQAFRMQQQHLLQLRATYLSEALSRRGLPLPTLVDVATPEGSQPPQPVDWDCALATEEDPKSCLYSFDAEPQTKVLAPLGTTQWISLGALNRLRRTDPTKVEPMWHSQYAVLKSWFDPESQYSLLQHVGFVGFALNALLEGYRLAVVVGIGLSFAIIFCMPFLEYFFNRMLVSGVLWSRWHQWSRFVHAALPLKLLLGQMAGKFIARCFDKLLGIVKERLVEWECELLENKIPLTVGVPTIQPDEDDDEDGFDALLDSDEEDGDFDFDSDFDEE